MLEKKQKEINSPTKKVLFLSEAMTGGGCRHWSEEIEKESTDEAGQKLAGDGGGDNFETEACSLVGNSGSDGQSMKISEYRADVDMWSCTDYNTGRTGLDSVKFAHQVLRDTSQESCNNQYVKEHQKQPEFLWHQQ